MFEIYSPKPRQQPLFPVDELIERRAAEIMAEIQQMVRAARESIDRRIAFHHRSLAQKRRFERYRALHHKD